MSSSDGVDVAGSRSLLASLATALALCAAMLVPSELVRCLSDRTVRRRVFEPRLARRGAWTGTCRECSAVPFSWVVVAWLIDDTEQEVVDELGLDGAPGTLQLNRPLSGRSRLLPAPAAVYIGTCRLGLRIILATAWCAPAVA
jgi:hypothetical protein